MARIDSGGCSVSADWLHYADPPLDPIRRSRTGSITPIIDWLQYADHEVAPLRRSVTPACVLVLNKRKPAALKGKVIIIDASRDYLEGKAQNSLRPEDIARVASTHKAAFEHQTEVENYCRVVTLDEIRSNDGNLNIARYIDNGETEEAIDVEATLSQLAALAEEEAQIDVRLNSFLAGLGKAGVVEGDASAKAAYHETEAGRIPVGWTAEKLSSLVDVVYGKSPAEIEKLDEGVPIFGTGGIAGYTNKALCDGPSVILGRKGTIDKVQRSDGPFWAIDTTFYTTPRRKFDWSWLYYAISSFDLKKLNEASGVPSLSRTSLEALDIATPPLSEQQRIAAVLTAIDERQEVIARQMEASQRLKRGLMQKLLKGAWRVSVDDPETET